MGKAVEWSVAPRHLSTTAGSEGGVHMGQWLKNRVKTSLE